MLRIGWLALVSGIVALGCHAQSNWLVPKSLRLSVLEKGDLITEKQFTVYRQGSRFRLEGTFPVGGALANTPHVRIISGENIYLYVPSVNAALLEPGVTASDRIEVAFPVGIKKALFSAPASLLQKELQKPAKLEGEEAVIGRACFLLKTTDAKSSVHQEKLWIDQAYGLVLRYHRIEAGKVVYSREVKEASFDQPLDEALFSLPEGVTVVRGGVSAAVIERLRNLGDITQHEKELSALLEKHGKTLNLGWVSTVRPPAGFGHATTAYRALRTAGPGGGQVLRPLAGPGQGARRFWTIDELGRHVEQVAIVPDGAQMEELPTLRRRDHAVVIQPDIDGGVPVEITIEDAMPPPGRDRLDRDLSPEMRARLEEVRRQQQQRAERQKPNEGMFISEFVEPESGKTLVFVQSKDNDPTAVLSSRGPLGESEKVKMGEVEGVLFTGGKPSGRVTLIWKQRETWFGLSSVGLSKEELVQVAGTLRPYP